MIKKISFLTVIIGTIILFLAISNIDVSADYKYDFYDFYEIETLLQDLETQSSSKTPDVFSLQTIGNSHLGNPIYAVKFSDNPELEEDAEPDVVIDSGMHSNEWLPVESNLNFIQYLFDVYYDDQHADHLEVVALVHNFEIWIIPMINPDGRIRDDLSGGDPESFWTDTTYHSGDADGWRMNVQEVDCPAKPGGTNIGIDPNRSWSRRFWENSNCAANYHGEAPFDPTETKVLKQFINNHMISLVFHQHSAIGTLFSNSTTVGLGAYITVEMDAAYEAAGLLDPLLALTNEIEMTGGGGGRLSGSEHIKESDTATGSFLASSVCNGMFMTGQYFNWLWYAIDCPLSSDHESWRAIQCVFYEYPVKDDNYGHPDEGKIGRYQLGDLSNSFHPSSGDVNDWIMSRSLEINKYIIKQSQYPFSPRYHTDMSLRPEAPTTDLAIVGAKISEVGTNLPGCFTYDESNGRDLLGPGTKRITWNVQNNGISNRTINSQLTICNLTDDPTCSNPTTDIQNIVDVPAEAIETLTYDYDFSDSGSCKDYKVTFSTGESNSYLNDSKIFIFTVTSTGDTDCDGTPDAGDNCLQTPNGPVKGTCVKTLSGVVIGTGDICFFDEACEAGETCQKVQGDNNGNGIGDACECYANIDCNDKVGLSDLVIMKDEFGRTDCATNPCQADCNGDDKVDLQDLVIMKTEFGRTGCPACP